MLLSDDGLAADALDPLLAVAFGSGRGEEGCNVLGEAVMRGHAVIGVEHWLYCLAKTAGTWVRRFLVDAPGQSVDDFVDVLAAGLPQPAQRQATVPLRLTRACVTDDVCAMLDRAEAIAAELRVAVDDAIFTFALVECCPERLARLLQAWAQPPRDMAAFRRVLKQNFPAGPDEGPQADCFDAQGTLLRRSLLPGARRLCERLVEDAASLGATRIGTRNLLYTLLGDEHGLLVRTLRAFGVEVKRDLHAALARELAPARVRRTDALPLTRATMFDTVAHVFSAAFVLARLRGSDGIAEHDLSVAFATQQEHALARLLAGRHGGVSVAAVRAQMALTEPDAEQESDADPLARIPAAEVQRRIDARIFGQAPAVARVMPWIKRLKFGLPRDDRPAAVFLFLGPTGTGKTQLAKELARYVFGDETACLFLEMGQFKTKESMSMFIGAPPGYVGYGDGKLTNGLRDNPQCVVLFDEIEKADTQVFDTLLRFADEGLISDPAGPVRDGRRCIIVMTTNAGQSWLRDHPDALADPARLHDALFEAAMAELSARGFRPEFLGRVDERISFLPLSEDTCRAIVDRVLGLEIERLRRLKDVTLEVDADARSVLARLAHARCAQEGARGVPRAINEQVMAPAIDLLTADEGAVLADVRLIATAVGKDSVKVEVRR